MPTNPLQEIGADCVPAGQLGFGLQMRVILYGFCEESQSAVGTWQIEQLLGHGTLQAQYVVL